MSFGSHRRWVGSTLRPGVYVRTGHCDTGYTFGAMKLPGSVGESGPKFGNVTSNISGSAWTTFA
jgi:hypothetical protein